MHWSLVVMVVLVAGGLAQSRFALEAPGHSGAAYILAGGLTAVGLLVGVLAHELGHAVVARRKGLTVDGITLSWMGGVTRIEGDTDRPSTELVIAGVGPLASAVVGLVVWLVRMGAAGAGAGDLTLAALGWLAWINIVLAVFNLLPASPLDGGRVLHALVWAAGRDRWRATRVAAGTGVVLGTAIIVLGLYYTERNRDLLNGVLVGIVGWWLLAAARAELGGGAVQRALEGVRMSDVMRPVGEAPGWITIRSFAEQYAAPRPGWVWLLRDWNGHFAGVVAGDAVHSVPYPQWDLARPLDVALPVTATAGAGPGEDVLTALARNTGHAVTLVVSGGHTVGAVLPADVEALIRLRRGAVPGRRPAPGPIG
jgi:Zn-dependent protease